jgi:hypothetical protein
VAQAIEHLPSKCEEALISNPSDAKKEKRKRKPAMCGFRVHRSQNKSMFLEEWRCAVQESYVTT